MLMSTAYNPTAEQNMPDEIIIAVIGGVSAVIGALTGGMFSRRRNNADASVSITNAAKNLIDPLNERIDRLEKQVNFQSKKIDRYGKRVAELMNGIEQLMHQIASMGQTPVWMPDCWDPDEEDSVNR